MPIKDENKWKFKFIILVLYFTLFAVVLPYFALFWGRAVEVELFKQRVFTYWGLGLTALMLIFSLRWAQSIVEKNPKRYAQRWGWLRAPFFRPEESILYKWKGTRWIVYPFSNQLLVFLTLWGIVGIFGVISNTAFAPIPQQVTKLGEFVFGIYPASPAETLLELSLIFIMLGIIYWLVIYRAKKPILHYWGWSVGIVPPIAGLIRVLIHTVAYGTEELKFVVAFMFGYIGAFFTIITNGILPFITWHDSNNTYVSLTELLASDTAVIILILSFLAVILTIIGFKSILRKKKGAEA